MSKCKKIILIVPLLMSVLMLVLSVWCSRQEAPSAPKLDVGLTGVNPTTEYRNEGSLTGIPSGELKFVKLPTIRGKKTTTYVEGEVTVKTGGHLHLDYQKPGHDPGRVHIKIDLKVRPYSVSSNGIWSLRLHPRYLMVDLTLKPKSIEFLKPAKLHIDAQNLNLLGVNPDNIGLYYYNEDKGEWELVEPIYLRVNVDKGHIDGCWYIEHFSRYAIASR